MGEIQRKSGASQEVITEIAVKNKLGELHHQKGYRVKLWFNALEVKAICDTIVGRNVNQPEGVFDGKARA